MPSSDSLIRMYLRRLGWQSFHIFKHVGGLEEVRLNLVISSIAEIVVS